MSLDNQLLEKYNVKLYSAEYTTYDIINDFLKNNIRPDDFINNFTFQIAELVKPDVINKIIKEKSEEFLIIGILFLPTKSSNFYIFIKKQKTDDDIYANFIMKPTPIPDVYNLFCISHGNLQKIGIAGIRTRINSHKFKDIFDKLDTDIDNDNIKIDLHNSVKVKCHYNKKFLKWEPMDLCEIDDIQQIDSNETIQWLMQDLLN